MSQSVSRRDALKQVVLLLGAAAAVRPGQSAHAAALPHLDASDPTAKAVGYRDDAKSVDAKAYPTYKAGSAGQSWGACNVFPGKTVNTNGWCTLYVKM